VSTTDVPRTYADAEQKLAANLPGYEVRPQQQKLAAAVERALADGTHLIAEAGCGTGKSFATAIPAILAGKRVAISTATKALQDQIAAKDMPFLAEHLGVPFNYALLKGRSNYLCKAQLLSDDAGSVANLPAIMQRDADGTGVDFDGTREELGVEVTDIEWSKLTISSDDCPGKKKCPFGATCHAETAKRNALQANVVIVNHALLMTEMKLQMATDGMATMLGPVDAVIVDEAHELEEYALSMFSSRITEIGLRKFATEVRNWVRENNLDDAIVDQGDEVMAAVNQLWAILEPGRVRPATILENEAEWGNLAIGLQAYAKLITEADLGNVPDFAYERAATRKQALAQRATRISGQVVDMVIASGSELVRWVEEETNRRKDGKFLVLKSAPIDISSILRATLFEIPTVLVSATIQVDGSFEYVAGRLGVDEYDSLDVGTPFDFETQARLYVPRELPIPSGATRNQWEALAAERTRELVLASKGRALLLFTSTKQMKDVYETIAHRLPYTTLMQGQAPNKQLAEQFKSETDSVLFATRSFFTGVDFGGETLSLVVIDKLPFPVPTEPITEARCEVIRARGGDDFKDYTIPVMSLILAQGFGRLIRTKGDAGVVAILDPRLVTKGYGSKIIRSLPDARKVEQLSDVEAFFAELEAAAELRASEVEV
jgi:ATP-dependent DNA helicase DinG